MKILVVALDNLGDAVMGTSVFQLLREAFPQAEIGYWVKAYARNLFIDDPDLHRVHACDPFWDKSPGRGRGSWRDFWKVLREIKAEKYDAALILNTEWRRALACWHMGIPQRIGYDRRKSRYLLTDPISSPPPGHFVDDHRRLVEGWLRKPIRVESAIPALTVSDAATDQIRAWRKSHGDLNKKLVVFHPLAGDSAKCWPLDHWHDLALELLQARPDLRLVWICGAAEKHRLSHVANLSHAVSSLLDGLPLEDIKALVKQSSLFVGGDSGPAHTAAALGVPVVVLFGPTDAERCGPKGRAAITVLRRQPLSSLPVAEVKTEILRILDRS